MIIRLIIVNFWKSHTNSEAVHTWELKRSLNPILPPGYQQRQGSTKDSSTLIKLMELSYQELFPKVKDLSHLSDTVKRYYSKETPLWLVEDITQPNHPTIGGLWLGSAVDQVSGQRYAHIFLIYIDPAHRRQGIAKRLIAIAQNWGQQRGDRLLGLQVFTNNQPALNLYQSLGFETRALLLLKHIESEDIK